MAIIFQILAKIQLILAKIIIWTKKKEPPTIGYLNLIIIFVSIITSLKYEKNHFTCRHHGLYPNGNSRLIIVSIPMQQYNIGNSISTELGVSVIQDQWHNDTAIGPKISINF